MSVRQISSDVLCGEKKRTFQSWEGNTEGREGLCSPHIKAPRKKSSQKRPPVTMVRSGHSNLAMLDRQAEEGLKESP